MKKQRLSAALLLLLSSVTYAESTTSNAIQIPTASETKPESTPAAASMPAPIINCLYAIAPTASVDDKTLSMWAEKAAIQSFSFTKPTLENQLNDLKACYTDQGWQGFREALDKSGNLKAITTQGLSVVSEMDGTTSIKLVKENQWKVTLPLKVVYQNDRAKLTQLLSIDLLIGRKITGELGIMQIIATPNQVKAS